MLLIVHFSDVERYSSPQITEVQRNQIMGHALADVFRRHYLHQTVKVDTQSAYLGSVDRGDLVGIVGSMSAKRDTRAPVKLSVDHGARFAPRIVLAPHENFRRN